MRSNYIFEHAACLRANKNLQAEAGDLAVIMQTSLTIKLPGRVDRLRLAPGETLYSHHVADLAGAVKNHLFGDTSGSDLRLAIGLILVAGDLKIRSFSGRYEGYIEGHVDAWLDEHTAFAVGLLPEAMMCRDINAPFNGLASAWRSQINRTRHG